MITLRRCLRASVFGEVQRQATGGGATQERNNVWLRQVNGASLQTANTMRWIAHGCRVRGRSGAFGPVWVRRRESCRMSCGTAWSRCCRSGSGAFAIRAGTVAGPGSAVRDLVRAVHRDRDPVGVPAPGPRFRLGHDELASTAGLERGGCVAAASRGAAGRTQRGLTAWTGPVAWSTPHTSEP